MSHHNSFGVRTVFCRSMYLTVLSFLPYKWVIFYKYLFSYIFVSYVLGRSIRPGLWQDFLEARLAWVKWHRRMWVWGLVMPSTSSLFWVLCCRLRKWTWHSGLALFFGDCLDPCCPNESQMWTTHVILHFLVATFKKWRERESNCNGMFYLTSICKVLFEFIITTKNY